jgi:hypothetical protein
VQGKARQRKETCRFTGAQATGDEPDGTAAARETGKGAAQAAVCQELCGSRQAGPFPRCLAPGKSASPGRKRKWFMSFLTHLSSARTCCLLGGADVVSLQVHNLSQGRGEGYLSTSGFISPDRGVQGQLILRHLSIVTALHSNAITGRLTCSIPALSSSHLLYRRPPPF